MDHKEAGRYWNGNAEAWTILSREGFDIYRDHLNTPAFFRTLPSVSGLKGIDIGCGEGYNTRLLAKEGAMMSAIDISEVFIQKAREKENETPLNINYQVASAVELPFADEEFDFTTGFMSFMDVPETEKVLGEAFRVLKRGGFLQFSITHPCFDTPHRKNLRNLQGITYAIEVGDYFRNPDGEISEWTFGAATQWLRDEVARRDAMHGVSTLPKFKIPKFTRTLSQWINALIETGFVIEYVNEPKPDDETVKSQPQLQDSQVVPYFLHIRCRKKG